VTVIKRLAYLEALPALSHLELAELNDLRRELGAQWPEVASALVMAYVRSDAAFFAAQDGTRR